MSPSAIPLSIPPASPQPWRRTLPVLLVLLATILFLHRDTVSAMVLIWSRSETFTHGFLVLPIALWLVWRQRQVLATQVPQATGWVLLPVAAAELLWLLGDLAAVNAATQLALTALLVFTVMAMLGLAVTRTIIFPLSFLFFAVPLGEFLMPQLMDWTANFTVLALRLSGIPVYREGLQFVIPSGSWSVVEACSGVRYLIASLMVGTLFAYLNYQSFRRRLIFVAVSMVVPVVANWMRAYIIVMLGHLSGNKLATGVDHLIYGWLFFGVVIMLMFIIGARWAEPDPSESQSTLGSATTLPTLLLMPSAAPMWVVAAAVALLAALPQAAQWSLGKVKSAGAPQLLLPATLPHGWQPVEKPAMNFRPAFKNPSAEVNATYAGQGRTVGVYLGYYQNQDYQNKLVSSTNALVTSRDPDWAQVAGGTRMTNLGDQQVAVRTAELRGSSAPERDGEKRLVVWQIYWINGTLTASDHLAKVYSALNRLMGHGDDAAVIIFYTPKDTANSAEALLESFVSANFRTVDEVLRKAMATK